MISELAVEARNLSKLYVLGGEHAPYKTFRESVSGFVKGGVERLKGVKEEEPASTNFWALNDVSFQVPRGAIVGIIGRNGAGKSTLLKILSRIAEPTSGSVRVRGRTASLLEVGTGFHPELTGRENIYLNGSVLGMTRAEIKRKFDEIVAFSGIEQFLDTPVKRYSSGMYVRLGFAVAAHLDPDILIVDEVLAVGDAEFQQKSLGKMRKVVSEAGRTVLFVSHNLQAVQSLCDRGILLDRGRIVAQGSSRDVVAEYLRYGGSLLGAKTWTPEEAPGDNLFKLISIRALNREGQPSYMHRTDDEVRIEFEFTLREETPNLCVGFDLANSEGTIVFRSYHTDSAESEWPQLKIGTNKLTCIIPGDFLNEGEFHICPRVSIHKVKWIVQEDAVLRLEMYMSHGVSKLWDARPGIVAPLLKWMAD